MVAGLVAVVELGGHLDSEGDAGLMVLGRCGSVFVCFECCEQGRDLAGELLIVCVEVFAGFSACKRLLCSVFQLRECDGEFDLAQEMDAVAAVSQQDLVEILAASQSRAFRVSGSLNSNLKGLGYGKEIDVGIMVGVGDNALEKLLW